MDVHDDIMPRTGPHLKERAQGGPCGRGLGGVLPLVFPLQIVAEEVSGTNDYVQLTFRAHKLDNKVKIPPLKTNPRVPALFPSLC